MEEISKEEFEAYEQVRLSGKHNMLMDWSDAMKAMKLNPRHKSDKQKYMDIISNYIDLAKKYLRK